MNAPALLYARFSPRPKQKEDECESIAVQLDRLRAYCTLAGLSADVTIEDPSQSAGVDLADRPQGKLLLDYLRQKRYRHVVVQRVDRLFRDAADGLNTVERWNAKGIALHLADQGGNSIRTDTPFGWFCFGQLALQAQFERMLISERTSGSMRRHQANGRLMSDIPPFGWREGEPVMVGTNGSAKPQRTTVEDPAEQAVIARIVELRAAGSKLREIGRVLAAQGITNRGGRWNHETISAILKRAGVA